MLFYIPVPNRSKLHSCAKIRFSILHCCFIDNLRNITPVLLRERCFVFVFSFFLYLFNEYVFFVRKMLLIFFKLVGRCCSNSFVFFNSIFIKYIFSIYFSFALPISSDYSNTYDTMAIDLFRLDSPFQSISILNILLYVDVIS